MADFRLFRYLRKGSLSHAAARALPAPPTPTTDNLPLITAAPQAVHAWSTPLCSGRQCEHPRFPAIVPRSLPAINRFYLYSLEYMLQCMLAHSSKPLLPSTKTRLLLSCLSAPQDVDQAEAQSALPLRKRAEVQEMLLLKRGRVD